VATSSVCLGPVATSKGVQEVQVRRNVDHRDCPQEQVRGSSCNTAVLSLKAPCEEIALH
jgi:hypothetical protein